MIRCQLSEIFAQVDAYQPRRTLTKINVEGMNLVDAITIEDAARILEISKQAAHRLVKRMTLPGQKKGGVVWTSETAVRRLKADEGFKKRSRSAWRLRQGELELSLDAALARLREGRFGSSLDAQRPLGNDDRRLGPPRG